MVSFCPVPGAFVVLVIPVLLIAVLIIALTVMVVIGLFLSETRTFDITINTIVVS